MAATLTKRVGRANGTESASPPIRDSSTLHGLAAPKRSVAWTALGVGLVALCALAGAVLAMSGDGRRPVLVTARAIAPGERIVAEDFRTARASTEGITTLDASAVAELVGLIPAGPIPAGVAITRDMFNTQVPLPAGQLVVGATLTPGAIPSGALGVGDTVKLIITSTTSAASVAGDSGLAGAVGTATVWAMDRVDSTTGNAEVWVSLQLDESLGTAVAQAAQAGTLRLALVGGAAG